MRALLLKLSAALLLSGAGAQAAGIAIFPASSAYGDEKGARFRSPEGIACTDAGLVAVADSGNRRLVTFRFTDGKLSGGAEIKLAQLGAPVRLQIDGQGNLLALDSRTRRIVRVSPQGAFLGFLEPTGLPIGRGFFPVSFKLDAAGSVYLLDVLSARVVVLDGKGVFERQLELPPKAVATDVAVDAKGTLYVVDAVAAIVYSAPKGARLFAPFSKSLRDYASFPTYLAEAGRGLFFVVDRNGDGLVVLGPDGSFAGRQLGIGWTEGLIDSPGQICVDGKGDVFIADRNNHRVQAFTPAPVAVADLPPDSIAAPARVPSR